MTDDIDAMRKELARLRANTEERIAMINKARAQVHADDYVLVLKQGSDSVLFWRKGKYGYTADLDDAEIFTEAQAWAQHRSRPDEDIPMPYAVAASMATRQVSHERFHRWLRDHPMPAETP